MGDFKQVNWLTHTFESESVVRAMIAKVLCSSLKVSTDGESDACSTFAMRADHCGLAFSVEAFEHRAGADV